MSSDVGRQVTATTNPDDLPQFLQPTTTRTSTYDLVGKRDAVTDLTGFHDYGYDVLGHWIQQDVTSTSAAKVAELSA